MMIRVVFATLILALAAYWTAAASFQMVTGGRPPAMFRKYLFRSSRPEPVLTATDWRKAGAFLFVMAFALALLGVRLLQGWL